VPTLPHCRSSTSRSTRTARGRVYQHLDEPLGALAEAHRILKPGGRIVLVDPDWGGLVVDADGQEVFRRAHEASIATRPGCDRRNGCADC
jgi:SAM-dependent methyltransferase